MKLIPRITELRIPAGVCYGYHAAMRDSFYSKIIAEKDFIADKKADVKDSYKQAVKWCHYIAGQEAEKLDNPLNDHESAFLIKQAKQDVKNFEFNKDRIHKGGAMGLLQAVEYAGSKKAKHAITNLRRRMYPPVRYNPLNKKEAAELFRDSKKAVKKSVEARRKGDIFNSAIQHGKASGMAYSARLYGPSSKFPRMSAISRRLTRLSRKNPLLSERVSSHEAQELYLYITNDGDLYRQQYMPIVENLRRKMKRGIFNKELAVKLVMYLVDNGARKYLKKHCSAGDKMQNIFPKPARLEVAREILEDMLNEYLKNPCKRNPLSRLERLKIERAAREHDRDSRSHKSRFLKGFDGGTAAGLREAVAMSRKNSLDPHANGMYSVIGIGAADTLSGIKQMINDKISSSGKRKNPSDFASRKNEREFEGNMRAIDWYKQYRNSGNSVYQATWLTLNSMNPYGFIERSKHLKEIKKYSKIWEPLYKRKNPKDEIPTWVYFRQFPDGEVIALFPKEKADMKGNISSYMHIGQHGAASPKLIKELESAQGPKMLALRYELESIGYLLRDIDRWPLTRKNPPSGVPAGSVLIAPNAKSVEYHDVEKAKAEGLANPSLPWRHDYKRGVKIYGLPDKRKVLLVSPKKKIWDYR